MLDSKQLKVLGLRFARALQTTIKTAGVFTVEHKSSERPIQQSFLLVNNMLKEVGQFTFGFVDNQVLLNNLLTTEPLLKNLETEFLKRGIAAITFEPGLTLSRYKKVIYVLSAPTSTIDAAGGFLGFLEHNEVDGVRILPAPRNQKKNAEGDTILETDSESYILSKQMEEDRAPRDFLDSIDALLESGCFDSGVRGEVLSNFATQGVDGLGYGVPIEVPKMVLLKEGEVISSETGGQQGNPPGGGGGTAVSAAAGLGGLRGHGAQPLDSGSGSPGGTGRTGVGIIGTDGLSPFPGGPSTSGGQAAAVQTGLAALVAASRTGHHDGSGSFLELVEKSVQRSLLEEKGDPEKSHASLARILRNTGVDKILERFDPERRQEVAHLSPERLAAEYVEDTALQLAGKRIASARDDEPRQKIQVEEEVVYLLARSLQATHMADRMAQKLTKFIQDYAVPPHIQEKIREELHWTALSISKKYARLMELKRYSNIEFRRLIELVKDMVAQRDMDRATTLAIHYFDFLDEPSVQIESSELSRAPQLIRAIAVAHAQFAPATAERLCRTLLREDLSEFIHFQASSTATVLAEAIAAFEDFQDVLTIGLALETSANRDRDKHKKCCSAGLNHLLSNAAIERITEVFLLKRDPKWTKAAGTLLRLAGSSGIESVFAHLIKEEDARNRLALVRLVSQVGKGGIEVACKYLADERWYVVRNMCGVLTELGDPELAEHIAPTLRHQDPRVQQAALKALMKSRSPKLPSILADALPGLSAQVRDEALGQLMFLKAPSTINAIEAFVLNGDHSFASSATAVQTLAAIGDVAALYALGRIFKVEELDVKVRRAALTAIASRKSEIATKLLEELSTTWGQLAEEARKELDKRRLN